MPTGGQAMTFNPWDGGDWRRLSNRTRVFISGPMFSDADKWQQAEIASALEEVGYVCFLPQRDGIEVGPVLQLLHDPGMGALLEELTIDRCVAWVSRAIACLDMYQAANSAVTTLTLEGRVPDEGSLVEGTAAWMNGHPVLPFQTTPIRELGKNNNPMIGLITDWVDPYPTVSELVDGVREAVSRAARPQSTVPQTIHRATEAGRSITGLLMSPFISVVPMQVVSVLEPDPALHELCRYVTHAMIDFAKEKSEEARLGILLDGVSGIRDWEDDGIHKALASPIPC